MTVSKQAIHCTIGIVGAEKSALVYLKEVVNMNKDWLLGVSLAINVGMGMLLLAWLIGGNA
ncbi:MAG: hypothetical protein ACI4P9_04445 [Selenomonadaceae bacterium]